MSSDKRYQDIGSHTFLVAFNVKGAESRKQAETLLTCALPRPLGGGNPVRPVMPELGCWWVAEDPRWDGSDNDSAVFVPLDEQDDWAEIVAWAHSKNVPATMLMGFLKRHENTLDITCESCFEPVLDTDADPNIQTVCLDCIDEEESA